MLVIVGYDTRYHAGKTVKESRYLEEWRSTIALMPKVTINGVEIMIDTQKKTVSNDHISHSHKSVHYVMAADNLNYLFDHAV